jgi:hypothetical protein
MKRQILILSAAFAAVTLSCKNSSDNPVTPEPQPSVSVADQSVIEGNTLLFAVTIDRVSSHPVTFAYATVSGTATAGNDFTAVSATDTIPSGETSVTILVSTIDDAEVESTESFSFVLSSVSGAQVNRGLAVGTITDNDMSDVSFATQVRPLLKTSCAKLGTCHGGAFPGGGMFLDITATYTNVMNATGNVTGGPVVVASNSSASTLYTKTTDSWVFGSRMPQGAAPLSLLQQALIRDWIDQGAQDN